MEDPAEQWRRQILSHVLAEGPLLFSDVGQVVKRPPGFTQKLGAPPLLSVVGGDPRFIVKGHGHAMTLSAAAPRRVLARPAAAAPDPGGMDDLAEQWRRQIHAGLLSEGPQLFLHVGKLARRPDGFNQKLRSVIGDDSRFVIKGDGHAMELSAAPARRVPARPAAAVPAAPSPSPYPQHPERGACERYTQTGSCPFGEKCHFDHPAKVDAVRSGTSAWGASRAEAPGAVAAGAREAAPVRRGTVRRSASCLVSTPAGRLSIHGLTSCGARIWQELPDRQERMGWAMANNKARARARLLQVPFSEGPLWLFSCACLGFRV